MNLSELTSGCEGICRWQKDVNWEKDVSSIAADSRKVVAGSVFVAFKGEYFDGHAFIDQALQQGACAIILEDRAYCKEDEPWILVKDSRAIYGAMQQSWSGSPSLHMNVVGVTGTNGKTTVTHMLACILEEAGKKTGLLGTIYNKVGERILPADLTTPGSEELAVLLRQMVQEQTDYVVMEVSSHALDQSRTAGIEFDLAIFTNLSQDHLDYHHSIDEYRSAKAKLFSGLKPKGEKNRKKAAIINFDDKAGPIMAEFCRVPVITYGFGELSSLRADQVELSTAGIRYTLTYGSERHEIALKLHGRFNVYNSLAAIAAALVEGIEIQVIRRALEKMEPVAGRFQQVSADGSRPPFDVFVDYSHTPDGLLHCLTTAKELCAGRIISVFGAGGHRDKTKRPMMGEVAARLSDITVVTSDNPRDEEPMDIINDILKGMDGATAKAKILTEPDRGKAIEIAMNAALPGDIVLICGKGHEDYQIIGQEKLPFDDYQFAQNMMVKTYKG